MTDHTAVTPLDLADMRARAGNLAPYEVRMDTIALCEEVERLRAENAGLTTALSLAIGPEVTSAIEAARMRPVVEAARAWDKWVREVVQAPPGALDGYEVSLSVAVAAYEQTQVVQPSPVSGRVLKPELNTEGQGTRVPAAGDQLHDFHEELGCRRYEGEMTSGCTCGFWELEYTIYALRDLVTRKNAALLAAARALGDAGDCIDDGNPLSATVQRVYAARDAAKTAAQEGE